MRAKRFLLLVAAVCLLLPASALTQDFGRGGGQPGGGFPAGGFPGTPGGGFGGGGFGGGGMDPNDRWQQMAGNNNVVYRNQITDPRMQRRFDMTAQMAGITDGKMTKQQYLSASQSMMQAFQQGGMQAWQGRGGRGGGGPGGPGGGGPNGGGPGSPGTPGGDRGAAISIQLPGTAPGGGFGGFGGVGFGGGGFGGGGFGGGGFNPDAMIEMRFKQYDVNGDGILNYDEMPEALRAERDKWDTNKDGFIDLNEFKEYSKARMAQWQQDRANNPGGGSSDPFEPDGPGESSGDRKPTIYRMSNLPKELAWMRDLDTDGDNQIGLYEWKNSGRPLQEFYDYDRNKDGFVTIDEAMFFHNLKYPGAVASNGGSPNGSRFPGMGMAMAPGMGQGMQTQFQMPPGGFDPRMMGQWGQQPGGRDRGGRGFDRGQGGFDRGQGGGGDRRGRGPQGMGGDGMQKGGGYGKQKGDRNRGGG
jgi:hypothetical protein